MPNSGKQKLSFKLGHIPQSIDHHRNAGRVHKGHIPKIQNTYFRCIGLDFGSNGLYILFGAMVVDLPGEGHGESSVFQK